MNIDLNQIRDKFDGLCSGSASREEVARFASRAIEADDIGKLHMEKSNEAKIWEAILYLSGVDLMDVPGEYLHTVSDFENARRELGV
ncbi:hypothetical protein N2599_29725 (plasmid) [Rhizobium sullae]|uniref:Uncharacterized protein n=1 Tax=Rhizobium sullae TaxID=50338 RepID=A0ABY5XQU7_RHISU|nr:hypothetical protein [Rhizobium sullae]UWU16985.1 hypothetical protein N2599_29725 [Rhizobium sullae]